MSFRENKTFKVLSLFQENCLIHTEMHQKSSVTSTSYTYTVSAIQYTEYRGDRKTIY